jgi:membrane protease YdiL (CAAX protease family)
MFIINERKGKVTNFLRPSVVVALGAVLLSFLQSLLLMLSFSLNFTLGGDFVILSLIFAFISQVGGILITYFVLIPLMEIKSVNRNPLTLYNLKRTLLFLCVVFAITIINNYIFIIIFNFFDILPQSGYSSILLNATQLENPLNLIIYYLPLTVAAPVFEELLYRRTLIPMLERRGMGSFTAVITSSIVFAFAHFPNDLINGNLYGGIIHCVGVFYISIVVGLIYVLTRNILFPIVIHSIVNFISFTGPIVITLENNTLLLSYNIAVFCIAGIGIGVLFYGIWLYFKRTTTDWVILLKTRSSNGIRRGLIGFIIIGIGSAFIPIIIEIISVNILILSANLALYLSVLLASYAIVNILLFLVGTRIRYEPNINIEKGGSF